MLKIAAASGDSGLSEPVSPVPSIATTLIFVAYINRNRSLQEAQEMRLRMDATLRFWVDCSYEDRRYENPKRTRTQLIAEILREYERSGDAMRYLDAKGQIAWKASPSMLSRLADAEREREDDMDDLP